MQKIRYDWLDVAKAIAIIAVVISHFFAAITFVPLVLNSFMLPIFFISTGICQSPGKYKFNVYIQKRVKSLIVPYICLGAFVSILSIPLYGINEVWNKILQLLFSWQTLWFLPVLFVADILYNLIARKSTLQSTIATSIFFFFVSCLLHRYNVILPLCMSSVFVALAYIGVGVFINDYVIKEKLYESRNFKWFSALSLAVGLLVVVISRDRLDLISNTVDIISVIYSLLISVGILGTIICSRVESMEGKSVSYLKYLGRNTMTLFAFHMPVFFYIQKYIKPLIEMSHFEIVLFKIAIFVFVLAFTYILDRFINRYIAFIIGK